MTTNAELARVNQKPFLRGFANLLRKENRAWWGTRRWWINAILWPVMLCGLLANTLYVRPGSSLAMIIMFGINVFFEFGITVLGIGTVILAQDLIISEKQNGVAEWLLSKPIAKKAFILAKLVANLIPQVVFMIGLPSLLGYILFSLRSGGAYPVEDFLGGVGMMALHSLFYLSLTLTLGIFFNSRIPVLAIAVGSILGGSLISGATDPLLIEYVTPWNLPRYAALLVGGKELPSPLGLAPIIATGIEIVVILLIGMLKFEKSEY